jgi:hypothetical protein
MERSLHHVPSILHQRPTVCMLHMCVLASVVKGGCNDQACDSGVGVVQYKNVRPDYLKAVWSVVNWKNVADRYAAAKAG